MKKIFLISLFTLTLVGCNQTVVEDTEIDFNSPVSYSQINGEYGFEFNEEDQTSYETLYEEIKDVDLNNIAAITTSTANLLYEIGITPVGISSSENLHEDLKNKRCNSHTSIINITFLPLCEDVDGGIQIIGDGTSTNNEILAVLNASRVFYSSSLPSHGGDGTGIADVNELTAINQTNFIDPFIVLEAFKQVAKDNEEIEMINKINTIASRMVSELEETKNLVESVQGDTSPTVVVVQAVMGGDTFLMNNTSAAGVISYTIGMNNVFANEADHINLSIESLIMANPDYLLIVGMGGNLNDAIYDLESEMRDSLSEFRTLKAVKNNNILTSEMSPSLDLNISYYIKEVANQIYGS